MPRFRVWDLLELTTVCALIGACLPGTGFAATLMLMLMAAGLALRIGWLAIIGLALAVPAPVAASSFAASVDAVAYLRTLAVVGMAWLLCGWYAWRRRFPTNSGHTRRPPSDPRLLHSSAKYGK